MDPAQTLKDMRYIEEQAHSKKDNGQDMLHGIKLFDALNSFRVGLIQSRLEDALCWGLQVYLSGKVYIKPTWDVVIQSSVADKGMANASLVIQIWDLYNQSLANQDGLELLCRAITLICTSPGTRVTNLATLLFSGYITQNRALYCSNKFDSLESFHDDLIVELDHHNIANSLYLIQIMYASLMRLAKPYRDYPKGRDPIHAIMHAFRVIIEKAPEHIRSYVHNVLVMIKRYEEQPDLAHCLLVHLVHCWCLDPLAEQLISRGRIRNVKTAYSNTKISGAFDVDFVQSAYTTIKKRQPLTGEPLIIPLEIPLYDVTTQSYIDATEQESYFFTDYTELALSVIDHGSIHLGKELYPTKANSLELSMIVGFEAQEWIPLCLFYRYYNDLIQDKDELTQRIGSSEEVFANLPEEWGVIEDPITSHRASLKEFVSFLPWISGKNVERGEDKPAIYSYRQLWEERMNRIEPNWNRAEKDLEQ